MAVFFAGSYTQKLTPEIIGFGKGIYTVQMDDNTGELKVLHTLKTINPSYLVISNDNKFLYCNTEVSMGEDPKVQAYKIREDFSLEYILKSATELLIETSKHCVRKPYTVIDK